MPVFSARITSSSMSARAWAAERPAIPPPTTKILRIREDSISSLGSSPATLATLILIRYLALSVASSLFPIWTQEH